MSAERPAAPRPAAPRPPSVPSPTADMPTSTQEAEHDLLSGLPSLLRELAAAGVVELDVSVGDARLYVRQRPDIGPAIAAMVPVAADSVREAAEEAGLVSVVTPLAGVFYAAPTPDEP